MSIIALAGYAGSGKDTVGRMIQFSRAKTKVHGESTLKALNLQGWGEKYNYDRLSGWKIKKFAKKLKQTASLLTGIPVEKFEDQDFKDLPLPRCWDLEPDKAMTVRQFLQRLGTDAVRYGLHPNTWVNALMADYDDEENWVITDCRFPNEAECVKEKGGVVIRINRPGLERPADLHESETALDNWDFDYVITNDGTQDELFAKVEVMLNTVNYNSVVEY